METDLKTDAKRNLEEIYKKHHIRGKRYGYLYCGGARGPYLKNWIGTGKTVVDLGCRDGELTKYYCEGNTVLGVDIDRHALDLAKEKLGIETLWLNLNEEFIEGEGEYDVIVACEVMEHLFFTQKFLNNVANALKSGGIFVGSVPNAFRIKNRIKFLFGEEFEKDPTHVHMFSYDKLYDLLSQHFTDIEIIPLEGKIFPFLKVSPYTPKVLNRLFGRDLLWKAVKKQEGQRDH